MANQHLGEYIWQELPICLHHYVNESFPQPIPTKSRLMPDICWRPYSPITTSTNNNAKGIVSSLNRLGKWVNIIWIITAIIGKRTKIFHVMTFVFELQLLLLLSRNLRGLLQWQFSYEVMLFAVKVTILVCRI